MKENLTGQNIFGRYPELLGWTDIAVFCYKQGCVCTDCPHNKAVKKLETIKHCHVKASVLELVRRYGEPPKKRKIRCVETGEIFDNIRAAAAAFYYSPAWVSTTINKGKACGRYHFEVIKI